VWDKASIASAIDANGLDDDPIILAFASPEIFFGFIKAIAASTIAFVWNRTP